MSLIRSSLTPLARRQRGVKPLSTIVESWHRGKVIAAWTYTQWPHRPGHITALDVER